jgi:hypothetical protein
MTTAANRRSTNTTFSTMLYGGSPRTLGAVPDVIERVLEDHDRLPELFDCLFDEDAIVRMRASDALEKVCRSKPTLLAPFVHRLLGEVAAIDQPSVQWHLAQMLGHLDLSGHDRTSAVKVLKRMLQHADDWIVITSAMTSLAKFAETDSRLRAWLTPKLAEYERSPRGAVATRARKVLTELRAT